MSSDCIIVEKTSYLQGEVLLSGAKNAVLVIMASLLLTEGKSYLRNVPDSSDVHTMIELLEELGARVHFDPHKNSAEIDTSTVSQCSVSPHIMKKMRASILVMGPLLARFQKARVALPGGCKIGERLIDFHLKGFKKFGIEIKMHPDFLDSYMHQPKSGTVRIILDYPSVGATENLIMYAVQGMGTTILVNAAFEPEVFDLIVVLKKMGAHVNYGIGATIVIEGRAYLRPIVHEIMVDRLEAGSILLAASIVGGDVHLPTANAYDLDCFLDKLEDMGHSIARGKEGKGVRIQSTSSPRSVNIKTGPYPGFPTDLQPIMMTALCLSQGECVIEETVHDYRMLHVYELMKMGAQISLVNNRLAKISGVSRLEGNHVIASDIRASCALVLAGLVAEGRTTVEGVHYWDRAYDALEKKLEILGAHISIGKKPH